MSAGLFIEQLIENLLIYFGGNQILLYGLFLLFVFGFVYILGLPRVLYLPIFVFALMIFAIIVPDYIPVIVVLLGIGLAYLIGSLFLR